MDNEVTQICTGRVIRKYRKQQLKSIEEFAWNTGMNDKYLGAVERGIYSISSNYLLKLHAEFGCPLYFFEEIHECVHNK
ncbi:hypothetical protein GCM10028778_17970 [Barrientosiimonas marina]|uniref:Helix-turn-helix domain-containing protein n=1 Tax=Lentibacillus kimchii TaxID=1542911 RepID=A0ABW2UTW5_9BACI